MIKSKLESLLFVAAKPLTTKKIAEILNIKTEEVVKGIDELQQEYIENKRGLSILKNGQKVQMVTQSDNTDVVNSFLENEVSGELTKPSLETLTIIAYKGPVSKPHIEQIRGVNCSLILRREPLCVCRS